MRGDIHVEELASFGVRNEALVAEVVVGQVPVGPHFSGSTHLLNNMRKRVTRNRFGLLALSNTDERDKEQMLSKKAVIETDRQ
jgi:hypothetical protein